MSGKHDMERVARLARHFRIPAMSCVNKFDLNLEKTEEIEAFAEGNGVHTVGRVPFDPLFTRAMVQGKTIFEHDGDSDAAMAAKTIWQRVASKLGL